MKTKIQYTKPLTEEVNLDIPVVLQSASPQNTETFSIYSDGEWEEE